MKALVQRVSCGSVTVDGDVIGAIGRGLVVLLGVREGDDDSAARQLARKTAALRIFPDDQDRMNRSLHEIGGEALVVSQFTLYADTRKGNRPSFIRAGDPDLAESLYRTYVEALRAELSADAVKTGRFGAMMQVDIRNDGPVTIELCTDAD